MEQESRSQEVERIARSRLLAFHQVKFADKLSRPLRQREGLAIDITDPSTDRDGVITSAAKEYSEWTPFAMPADE